MPQALEFLVQDLIYPPPAAAPLKTNETRQQMNTSGADFFRQALSNVQVTENPYSHLLEEEEMENKRKQSMDVPVNQKPFEGGFDTESSDRVSKKKKKKPPS